MSGGVSRRAAIFAVLLSLGGAPLGAENLATEPGMPWPVVSEEEVQRQKPLTVEIGGADANPSTEPGMPWPVVSEEEAKRQKGASPSEAPPSDAAAPAEAARSVTEPGMPWPVVGGEADGKVTATDSSTPGSTPEAAAGDGGAVADKEQDERSVTVPGMPWPVVEDRKQVPAQVPAQAREAAPTTEGSCVSAVETAMRSGVITFRPAQATLEPASLPVLDRVATALKTCSGVRVVIAGHTDAIGLRSRNLALSRERAQRVASYLKEQGIDARLLVPQGFGQSRPVASNDTPAGRAKNRRIEIKVERLSEATQ